MKLRIEKAIYGGAGLARIPIDDGSPLGGKTVFVGGTLPGETVEAAIVEEKRSFSTGRLEQILEASPERIAPACNYVPRCGGCQYQHAGAAYQLEMKRAILQETLERAHVAINRPIETVAGPAWGYRNRIRLHVVKGQGRLGYREGGTHRLLAVDHCPIAAPLLEKAIRIVSGLKPRCEEVELFTNGEQNQLLVSLWDGEGDLEPFAQKLKEQLPELTGVAQFGRPGVRYSGQRSLTYEVGGYAYQASVGGFFQTNRFLLPRLADLVLRDHTGKQRTGDLAWDLYSGAGLFAKALNFTSVTAVESAGPSAQDLERNLRSEGSHIVRSSTLDFLSRAARSVPVKPDLIVVDPPRAGLGAEVCTLLGKIAPREMVYVSCDPATLARDLQSLLQNGYSVESIHLIDMFPQTFHMETVTSLKAN